MSTCGSSLLEAQAPNHAKPLLQWLCMRVDEIMGLRESLVRDVRIDR